MPQFCQANYIPMNTIKNVGLLIGRRISNCIPTIRINYEPRLPTIPLGANYIVALKSFKPGFLTVFGISLAGTIFLWYKAQGYINPQQLEGERFIVVQDTRVRNKVESEDSE